MKERCTSDTATQSVYASQVVYSPQYTTVNNAMNGASITTTGTTAQSNYNGSISYTGTTAGIKKVLSNLIPNVPVSIKIKVLYNYKPLYIAVGEASAATPNSYTNLLYSTMSNGSINFTFTPTQTNVELSIKEAALTPSIFATSHLCFTIDSVNYTQQNGSTSSTQLVQISSKQSDKYRFGFNGQEKDNEIAGMGNHNTAEFWEYDTRVGRRWNTDPVTLPFESPYAVNHNNPIQQNDPLGNSADDPKTHTVKKGETLSAISKRVGVGVDDLAKMNHLKDKNKLSIGQTLKINPEVDFKDNPHGGYSNPNNSEGTEVSMKNTFAIGGGFAYGIGPENELVTSGKAMDALRSWDKVENLTNQGAMELWKDGKLTPGETFTGTYRSPNIPTWLHNQTNDKFADKKFFTPQHVIGSFNLTMRVNADGYTTTICIYDAKTISSMSDGIFGKSSNSSNSSKNGRTPLSTQYQRFIWDVFIVK